LDEARWERSKEVRQDFLCSTLKLRGERAGAGEMEVVQISEVLGSKVNCKLGLLGLTCKCKWIIMENEICI